jgi:hypothetical protein
VARAALARAPGGRIGPVDVVGATTVSDRANRTSHEVDLVALRGRAVVALGEAKLRRLGRGDLDRLRRVRDLMGVPDARLVLASADQVDAAVAREPDVVTLSPADVYG